MAEQERRVLRAPAGTFSLVAAVIVALLLFADLVVRGGWDQTVLVAPWLLLILWLVYILMYAPRVVVTDRGVRIHNVLRVAEVPWTAVADIVMRWQLELHLVEPAGSGRGKTVLQAWAVAAPRRYRPRLSGRPSSREAEAEETLDVLRGLHEAALASAPAGEPATVTRTWDVPAVVAGALIVAWCAVAVAIAG
ncbi:PH domain-containing protein [Microbacterium album]|uniref:Low molecular weight protein antigen 6 PH domain-containing protein n=1 Tax=Microbacterium album TaxID=2053191 RepID=A0A917IHD6_9MICO|nr:PH domain-containing protein [Microbacterium album]GGH49723.1 hypothetical protein GCM10010921_27990 [Microbacterium album]